MALTQGSKITASDMNALKTRVKAEMARRKYYNSLADYTGDFSAGAASVAAGNKALKSHFNETVGYINKIKATGISSDKIYAIKAASDALAVYEARAINASVNDCSAQCTGLCISQCSNTCTGGCSGGCNTTCTGGCNTTCTGGCSTGCSGSCTNGCSGCSGCGSGCKNNCADYCGGGGNGCQNSCTSGCANWS